MYQHFLHPINKNSSKGFTLIELVVTIALAGVLSVVVASIMSIALDSYNLFNAHATMCRESQDAVRVLSDKIGMAIPSNIAQHTNRQLRFDATNGENIHFQYNNGQKFFRYRIQGSSWRELIHNMTGFSFSYLKEDGSNWNNGDPVAEIKRVNVTFGLSYLGETQNYSASFTIRN